MHRSKRNDSVFSETWASGGRITAWLPGTRYRGGFARVRFAFSPLQEVVMSLGALSDPGRHVVHLPWVERTREALGSSGVDLGPALALTRGEGYIPDFLTPPPLTPLPTFEIGR